MSEANLLFAQLALVLGLSSILGYLVRWLSLPLLVSYILTGVILAPLQIFAPGEGNGAIRLLPEIGIAFVLFLVGMELDFGELKTLGRPIIIASITQIIISTLAGFGLAQILGFPYIEALFLGVGLAFSSTIVVVKLLVDKKDLVSLYGKLSLGILLLEDLVAVVILMLFATSPSFLNGDLQNPMPFIALFIKGALMFISVFIISKYVLGKIFNAVAQSAELLFLVAISWCFLFITISLFLGFSVIIGAFLAGVALASSPFHYEIQGKARPLRDFFVALFFVYLGSQVVFRELPSAAPLIAAMTLFALLLKPLIFTIILSVLGFKKHTTFQTALNLSQISEFSLIIAVVGLSVGLVSQTGLTAMALVAVLSILLSSIMISFSKQIYTFAAADILEIFAKVQIFKSAELVEFDRGEISDHVILVGANRLGRAIVNFLKGERIPFLVLDFNPKVVRNLMEKKVMALYGDIGDPEIFEFLNLKGARLIISTAQDKEDNFMLLAEIKKLKARSPVVVRAATAADAKALYRAGADYVILPEMIAGDFVRAFLRAHWPNLGFLRDRAKIEMNKLNNMSLAME